MGVGTLLLVQFPTTLQDDVNLLGAGETPGKPLPDDVQNAVRFRIEKKKILNEYLQQMAQALKVGDPVPPCRVHPHNPRSRDTCSAEGVRSIQYIVVSSETLGGGGKKGGCRT